MDIQLKTLVKDWPCTVEGEVGDVEIRSVTEHSTRVSPGSLFIARKGKVGDGFDYVEEAIENGAAAIVVDRVLEHHLFIPVPVVIVPDCLHFLAYAAATLAGNPAESLNIIAITGTNGKTTVAHYIGQLLLQAGRQVAVIGTVGVYMNGQKDEQIDHLTTLTAEQLHRLLKRCLEKGITDIVMEASSMGLAQDRLAFCPIDIGVLLNIGEDHYEEHGGKDRYLLAKQQLVDDAIYLFVNEDSEICQQLSAHRQERIQFFSTCQLQTYPMHIQQEAEDLIRESHHFRENIVAALAVASYLQIPISTLPFEWPEGRMEKLTDAEREVYIDYAHTPEALRHMLEQLCVQSERLSIVFGCGGERDQKKRAKMGAIAAQYAQKLYITSDNPRHERPEKIIKDILQGIDREARSVIIEVNRKKAIARAITEANVGDVIVIAGRGHEQFQQVGSRILPLSDYEVAYEMLQKLKK